MPATTENKQHLCEGEKPLPLDPVIEAYKRHVDRTLLRENLKLTVEERLVQLMQLQRFAEEMRRAGRHMRPLNGHS